MLHGYHAPLPFSCLSPRMPQHRSVRCFSVAQGPRYGPGWGSEPGPRVPEGGVQGVRSITDGIKPGHTEGGRQNVKNRTDLATPANPTTIGGTHFCNHMGMHHAPPTTVSAEITRYSPSPHLVVRVVDEGRPPLALVVGVGLGRRLPGATAHLLALGVGDPGRLPLPILLVVPTRGLLRSCSGGAGFKIRGIYLYQQEIILLMRRREPYA